MAPKSQHPNCVKLPNHLCHTLERSLTVAARDEPATAAFAHIEPVLRPEIQRSLEEAILLLARKQSPLTWIRTKRVLRKKLEMPSGLREAFNTAMVSAHASNPNVAPAPANKLAHSGLKNGTNKAGRSAVKCDMVFYPRVAFGAE